MRLTKKLTDLTLVLLLTFGVTGNSYATEYSVDKKGDDANVGTSAQSAKPTKTPQKK